MSRSKKSSYGTPRTKEESSGIPKAPARGKLIACSKCKKAGGTLIKRGDNHYEHQDKMLCNFLRKHKDLEVKESTSR